MIKLENLIIGYKKIGIVKPMNKIFPFGSMTAIIGENGSGKSTLLKTIAKLIPPISGKIIFNFPNKFHISYLSQKEEIDRQFPLTVFDIVAMGCWPNYGLLQYINSKGRSKIWNSLESVGLESYSNHLVNDLSDGQFQRMLFARILVQSSQLLLLDEPFNYIDKKTSISLMKIINQLNNAGKTIIIVLHDEKIVKEYFSQTLLL